MSTVDRVKKVGAMLSLPYEPAKDISMSIERGLCNDCVQAVSDILSSSIASSNRWQSLQTNHDTITYLKAHLDGRILSLQKSKANGCALCSLILLLLLPDNEPTLNSTYWIFVRPLDPHKHDFNVCLGDVERFTRNMSEWSNAPSRRLSFFSRANEEGSVVACDTQSNNTKIRLSRSDIPYSNLPNRDQGSEKSFQQARVWLDQCRARHGECHRPRELLLPKRVVYLGPSDKLEGIRLYLPKHGELGEYATVSYTWGAHGFPRLKTQNQKENNVMKHCRGIEVQEFPPTLRDAIYIAKKLGFKFLWIDSLCIVQDNKDDFDEQVAAMTDIYGNARLNISASSSYNSGSGILNPTGEYGRKVGIIHSAENESGLDDLDIYVAPPLEVLDLEEKHASTRGWIFQERLVSVATLHYTDGGMLWECAHTIQLGQSQGFRSVEWKTQWSRMKKAIGRSLAVEKQYQKRPIDEVMQSWYQWVAAYAARDLCNNTDRLPAIAGMAKTISESFGLVYVAGLWEQDILQGLLWKRFHRTKTLRRYRSQGDTTPSWTWASAHGTLQYKLVKFKDSSKGRRVEIVPAPTVEEKKPGSFGRVLNGTIKMKGLLQKVVVDRSIHPGVRQREWQEVGVSSGFKTCHNVLVTLDDPYITQSREYPCWCLRIGSYNAGGRDADLFLLLDKDNEKASVFTRIGLVEVDPWTIHSHVIEDSGLLESPELTTLELV